MASRGVYTALTPDASVFALPATAADHARNDNDTRDDSDDRDDILPPSPLRRVLPRTRPRWLARAHTLVVDNTGLLLVAASQAFFSVVNVAVKALNRIDPPVPALQLVFVRMGITYLCCIAYMLWKRVPDPWLGPKGVRLLLVFRGFIGFFGLFGLYFSLRYLSLSDATVLTFLAPMCTGIVGALVLHEPFSRREALASLCGLLGVVFIARPAFIFGRRAHDGGPAEATPAQRLLAVGVALIGVVGATGAYISIRAIGKRAHALHTLSAFAAQCVVAASVAMAILRIPVILPARADFAALLLLIGVCGFTAQVLLTLGLQRETAGRGTIAVYVQIIFATVLERVFFHTAPSLLSLLGTVIIMSSAVYVALTKERRNSTPARAAETEDEGLEEGLLDADKARASLDSVGAAVGARGGDARAESARAEDARDDVRAENAHSAAEAGGEALEMDVLGPGGAARA